MNEKDDKEHRNLFISIHGGPLNKHVADTHDWPPNDPDRLAIEEADRTGLQTVTVPSGVTYTWDD